MDGCLNWQIVADSLEADLRDDAKNLVKVKTLFTKERHKGKNVKKLNEPLKQWRIKERKKTVNVALVVCLNIGVDPPDVIKVAPCARLECWIDPQAMSPQKVADSIGKVLQQQYERWQPRALYKLCFDPTVEAVKKLCMAMRRNARDERTLFHYNGHGVPKPTDNGEIWVFNKDFTQYIPLSLYDLQQWLGSSTVCVFECSGAGMIAKWFEKFLEQCHQDRERAGRHEGGISASQIQEDHILLAACGMNETLPTNPALPADMFTSCLTTPIKMALRWALMNTILLDVSPALVDQIPGKLNDRRTPLGELNWIFTAVTDTIAWTVLPKHLFQKLFRQDLLVACLFRNFLLAERIMPSCRCTPISVPKLPPTYNHPMWLAWDLTVDSCLSKLSKQNINYQNGSNSFKHYSFFSDQLTAFEVWMKFGAQDKGSPEQLPIVLQVLLSQQHRLRALKLLGRFLDLGSWAVNQGLCVGIFPYVLKLLQSPAPELMETLVFVWTKILAVDKTCQTDLAKEDGHVYFLKVLENSKLPATLRIQSAFVLSAICNGNRLGQSLCLNSKLLQLCLNQISDEDAMVRKWAVLCLSMWWESYDEAQEMATKGSACEKLSLLLTDPIPEVRAAVVYALGAFVKSEKGSTTAKAKNEFRRLLLLKLALTMSVATVDASPMVRTELVIALARFVDIYAVLFLEIKKKFKVTPLQKLEVKEGELSKSTGSSTRLSMSPSAKTRKVNEYRIETSSTSEEMVNESTSKEDELTKSSTINNIQLDARQKISPSSPPLQSVESGDMTGETPDGEQSEAGLAGLLDDHSGIYEFIWKVLLSLATDPFPGVSKVAQHVVKSVQRAAKKHSKYQMHQGYLEEARSNTDSNGKETLSMSPIAPTQGGTAAVTGSKQQRDEPSPSQGMEQLSKGRMKPLNPLSNYEPSSSTSQGSSQLSISESSLGESNSKKASMSDSLLSPGVKTTAHKSTTAPSKNPGDIPPNIAQKTNPNSSKISTLTSFLSKTLSTHLVPSTTQTSLSSQISLSSPGDSSKRTILDPISPTSDTYLSEANYLDKAESELDNLSSIEVQLHASLSEDPLVRSTLYDEARARFSSPLIRPLEEDEMAPDVPERWWKRQRNEYLMNEIEEWISSQAAILTTKKLETEVVTLENESAVRALTFNSFEPILCIADDSTNVVVWNWEQGNKMAVINNHKSQAKITSLSFLNEQETPFIAVGSDDGIVRVWDNIYSNSRLVTAWCVLMNVSPASTLFLNSLVLEWQQQNQKLLASGNANLIRVWDLDRELSIQDIPTNVDFPVTCMTSDKNTSRGTTVITGFEDGSIQMFDLRQPTYSTPIAVYTEHRNRIVNISVPKCANGIVVSGSSNGSIKFWDQSGISDTSQRTISSLSSSTMVAFSVYEQASIMAIGTHDQRVKIMNFIGNELSVIKYHDGFLRQRIGPINCMTFHPYSTLLAVGANDSLVSVYAGEHIKANPS